MSAMENNRLLLDDPGCPSSSISSGMDLAYNLDPKCDWNTLSRIFPIVSAPGYTSSHTIEQLVDRTCLARKCLVMDELMNSMAPVYAWGDSPFVALSKNQEPETVMMRKEGREQFMIGLHRYNEINDNRENSTLYWSDVLSISNVMDKMLFNCLDMMSSKNGLIIQYNQDEYAIKNLSSAFSSVEKYDCLVSKIVCNPCHADKLALGEVGLDLNIASLQREWVDAGSLQYPHIWTADILVSSSCPEDKIYVLPDAPYLGVTPVRNGHHGIAITNKSFSVLKL